MSSPGSATGTRSRLAGLLAALGDQGSQSLATLLITVAAARALTLTDFGRFSIVFAALLTLAALLRSLTTEPFLVLLAAKTAAQVHSEARRLLVTTAAFAVPPATGFLALSVATDGVWRISLIFAGVQLPILACLIASRACAIAADLPGHIGRISATWVGTLGLGLLASELFSPGLPSITFVACAASTTALLVGVWPNRRAEPPTVANYSAGEIRRLGVPLTLDSALTLAMVQALVPLAGWLAGLEAAAGVRGAWAAAGPVTTLVAGLRLGIVADAARHRDRWGDQRWRPYYLRMAAVLAGLASLASVGLWAVLQYAGDDLLGNSWAVSQPLLLPMFTTAVASSTHVVGTSVLRVRQRAKQLLGIRIGAAGATLGFQVVGVLTAGATGAAWGLAAGAIAAGPLWFLSSTSSGVTVDPRREPGLIDLTETTRRGDHVESG